MTVRDVNFETEYNVNIDSNISKVLSGSGGNFSVGMRAGNPIISSPINSLKITESTAALIDPVSGMRTGLEFYPGM